MKPRERDTELLLRRRAGGRDTESADEVRRMEALALSLGDDARPQEIEEAAAALKDDEELGRVLLWHERPMPAALQRAKSLWRMGAVAATILVLFAAALAYWSRSSPNPTRLRTMGEADTLAVAIARADQRFVAQSGERLEEGDRLGLFYSTEEPGHLAVFAVEANEPPVQLFPSDEERSAPIVTGQDLALPNGVLVGPGERCEWIVAVFSDAPLLMSDMAELLARAPRRGCQLLVEIPEARRVRVFSVGR